MQRTYNELQKNVNDTLGNIAIEHLKIAYKAHMTHHEMITCQEISRLKGLSIESVLMKMASFKESIEHRLYKKDFSHLF